MHYVRQAACGLGLALLAGCASIGAGSKESATVATATPSAPAAPGGGQTLAGVNPTQGAGPPETPEKDAPASPEKEKQESAGETVGAIINGMFKAALVMVVVAAAVVLGVAGGIK